RPAPCRPALPAGRAPVRAGQPPRQPGRRCTPDAPGRPAPPDRAADPPPARAPRSEKRQRSSAWTSAHASTGYNPSATMVEPTVLPRSEHNISRRDIDPDALKVLYRLREHGYTAYLVGGSVRDLLLGRRPKAFDIGTSAHPYELKKLFRNCWIIGRRFRLP